MSDVKYMIWDKKTQQAISVHELKKEAEERLLRHLEKSGSQYPEKGRLAIVQVPS